jgi:hypothetical protein
MKCIRFLVSDGETDVIKPDDPVQFPRWRTKQILWIPMRVDRIRYADERFVSRGHRKPRSVGQFFGPHPSNLCRLKVGCRNASVR